ncbi:hypothetical protein Drorol1_Dr00002597 [Drosera rotundifolia]
MTLTDSALVAVMNVQRQGYLNVLKIEAYARYEAEAKKIGATYFPKSDIGLETAINPYDRIIRNEKMATFCRGLGVQAVLLAHLNQQILRLEAIGDVRTTGTFQNYMAVLGGQVTAAPTTGGAATTVEENVGGQGQYVGAEGSQGEVGDVTGQQQPVEQQPGGGEGPPVAQQQTTRRGGRKCVSTTQPQASDSSCMGGRTLSRYPCR